MRILPIGMRAWSGWAASCPRDGYDMVILKGGAPAAIDAAIARLGDDVATVVVAASALGGASACVRGNATSVVRMGHRVARLEQAGLVCGPACRMVWSNDPAHPRLAWGVQYRPGSARVRGLRADVAPDDRQTRLMFLS